MQIQSLPWLITTPRIFLLLSASTAIGFQPWHLSAASTGQSFKKIQIFLSYNRSSKRPTVQTSSLAVDLLRERFSFKNTWFTEVSHVGSTRPARAKTLEFQAISKAFTLSFKQLQTYANTGRFFKKADSKLHAKSLMTLMTLTLMTQNDILSTQHL